LLIGLVTRAGIEPAALWDAQIRLAHAAEETSQEHLARFDRLRYLLNG
jgi:hypothetical protein